MKTKAVKLDWSKLRCFAVYVNSDLPNLRSTSILRFKVIRGGKAMCNTYKLTKQQKCDILEKDSK